MRKKNFISLILFHCSLYSSAQQYSFRNYTVADGLGSSSVNHIFQDSKGYIWFATQGGGVSRFNGKEFKNFTKADGLVNNDVTYITEDGKGNIWIGTASGASEFNGTSFHNYQRQQGLTDEVVYAIYADTHNKIWFATQGDGVKFFDGSNFDSLTVKDGVPSNEAYCIAEDKSGNYWFGFSNGIAKYHESKILCYRDSMLVKDRAFFSARADENGNVWFGSIGHGVLVIRADDKMQILELPAALQNDFIGGITQDKRGNFWIATDHGLLKYDEKKFKLFSEHDGLSVNAVQTVMCDYEGNIWVGTLGGGVNLLSSEAFVHYTDKDGLTSRNITCMEPDPNGKFYYIGSGDGLYLFAPELTTPFLKAKDNKEIAQANISSLAIDKKGLVWLCTQEGVFVLEKKNETFRLIKKYERIGGKRLISPTKIIFDSKGNCWIATYGSGIFFLNGEIEKSYNTKNGFANDNILTLYEDNHSNIWAGTYDAGILRFDGETFHSLSSQKDSSNQSVWCIAEDNDGNIYWGSGESGLYRYNGNRITQYSTQDGLNSDFIKSLSWDKNQKCLWLGSEKGLDKLEFADNKIKKIHAYTEQDGIKSDGINQDAIWTDKQGLLWLGTVNGLWLFNHEYDFPKNVPPKIQLTDIRLFYQKTDWKNFSDSIDSLSNLPMDLKLPYNKNHLTFDIQALTTENVQYIFILEGQDEKWSLPAKGNEITYSNINPGHAYTFKAKAVSDSGINSAETISFSFTINPPWWSTWWFRISVFVALIAALTAFIKTREKVLREQNLKLETTVKQRTLQIARQKEIVEKTLSEKEGLLHEKEILLKEIHHRVKNNLQTISSMLMLQSAGLKDEEAKKAITESQSRVRSIALVHQKLYQTDGLEKVELNAFVKDLTEQVKSFYSQRSKLVSISLDIPEIFILIDTAIPLGLILNELLTNSFKYAFDDSANGQIKIELHHVTNDTVSNDKKAKRKKVKLIYFDNGPGLNSIELIENASTLGLRLVNLLSQQIGAVLNYSNSNGSEFIFTFELSD